MSFKSYIQKFQLSYTLHNFFARNKKTISGKNNHIKREHFVSLKNVRIKICGNNNTLVIGKNSTLHNCLITISGNNSKITIGSKTEIINSNIMCEGTELSIRIGSDVSITGPCKIYSAESNNSIEISDGCLVGFNTVIMSSDAHPIYDCDSSNRINLPKSILFEERVWICSNCTILKGVTIGHDTVVAANSFITSKSIPNNVICTTNGKELKKSIRWNKYFEKTK